MKRKITLLLLALLCICTCAWGLSACSKGNSEKSAEVTELFVSTEWSGSYQTGDDSYTGHKSKTEYTFNFISSTEVEVKYEYTVKYGGFFEGKLDDEYNTYTYTRKYKIKVYNDGTAYIFIETFGSDGENISNDKKAFGKIKFGEEDGIPYRIIAEKMDVTNSEYWGNIPNLTDKYHSTYISSHEHNFSSTWEFDINSHWHFCGICNRKETAEHNLSNNKCTVCGYDRTIDIFSFTILNNGYAINSLNDKSITEVEIPSTYKGLPVIQINDYAFSNCFLVTSIVIPDSIISIGQWAFNRCDSLTSITIPNSVTSIEYCTFYNCSSLKSIVIPNSVTSIGKSAFNGCSSLTNITIPNGVTSIGEQTFFDCSSLTSIIIPNSVTSIGISAFYNCRSLTNITLPQNLVSIDDRSFYGCSSLENIILSDGLTSIGDYTFYNCSSLKNITIPQNVIAIGEVAFSNCKSLSSVIFENTSGWWYSYSKTATKGSNISSNSLSNSATAAKFLTNTYSKYYWKCDKK